MKWLASLAVALLLCGAAVAQTIHPDASISPGQIPGTQTNDDACPTCVGAVLSNVAPNTTTSLTNLTYANSGASVTLTPGDWDVSGNAEFVAAASTSVSQWLCTLSPTSASPNNTIGYLTRNNFTNMTPGGTPNNCLVGPARFSVSAPTQIWLVVRSAFTTSTMTVGGAIFARRAR
jgi:hypothetical protein